MIALARRTLSTGARLSALAGVLAAAPAALAQTEEQLEVTFNLAQYSHAGSWSFSLGCSHTPPTGRGNYVALTVVWLEDMNGNYLTTLHRWGRTYGYDLKAWAAKSEFGIDGVTTATPTSPSTDGGEVFRGYQTGLQKISWLPDGTYRIRLETTQCELADDFRSPPSPDPFPGGVKVGPSASFDWVKGRTSQSSALLGSSGPFGNVRVNYNVPATNAPPAVWAGVDQWRSPSTVPAEATTMLSGTASDPAGAPTVAWSLVSRRPATAAVPTMATPNALTTSVTFTQAGIYTFRLTATDSGGAMNTDDVTVYVNARLVDSAGDAEVVSGSPNTNHGTIEPGSGGPWAWGYGTGATVGSRSYFRFDLGTTNPQITYAQLQMVVAEYSADSADIHDFYILTDGQDDWNGPSNASTDYEATVTWNNQPVSQGNPANLMSTQLAGSFTHLVCMFRHAYANPNANPGQAASTCPIRWAVDLDVARIRTHSTNSVWSFFMAPRAFLTGNGAGMASDENAIHSKLLVVTQWQSGTNMPPVAVPGTYPPFVDRTPPLGSESVTLDASGSTDDSAIISYQWKEGPTVLGSGGSPMFTTNLSLGIHTLELTVNDGALSHSATTTVVVEDRFEPNHTRATAAPVTGSTAGQQYPSLFASAAAPAGDWYSVDLVAGSTLTVAITMAAGNLDLHLYDTAGTRVAGGTTTSLTETAMLTASSAGKYFIQVEAVGGNAGASTYSMRVTASGGLTVALNPSSAVESAGTLTAAGTVRLDAAATAPVMVTLTSSKPAQLTFPSATVTIPMGQTSAPFDIRLIDDPPGVPNASRFVDITATAANYNPGSASFEILDNEATLVVQWEKAAETVREADSPSLVIRAVLSGTPSGTVTVPFTITGTATPGTDIDTQMTSGQLSFTGSTSASTIINVVDDKQAEPSETVILTLGTPTGASLSGATTYTLTILDDESGGTGGGGATGDDGGTGGGGSMGECVCRTSTPVGALAVGLLVLAARLRRRRGHTVTEPPRLL